MVGFLEVAPYFFFPSIKFHTKPLMSSLPKLVTNCSIGNIMKIWRSINQSIIYFNTLRQRAKKVVQNASV